MQVFKSRVDRWLLLVLVVSVVMSLAAAAMLAAASTAAGEGNALLFSMLIFVVLLGIALPCWLLVATDYCVADGSLVIRSGPFRWKIPVASITVVRDTRNPLSSPALSLDRLELQYDEGKKILVSPADKAGFRQALGHPKQ